MYFIRLKKKINIVNESINIGIDKKAKKKSSVLYRNINSVITHHYFFVFVVWWVWLFNWLPLF